MATLKISDLSVGDWVGFEMANLSIEGDDIATAFVEKIKKPARIKSILGDQDLILAEVDNVDNFGTIYLKIEHILPVPITAEILEKNGISKTYESDEYAVYKGEGINVTEYYTELWKFEKGCNRLMIRNVHQLQHALRLAGVDKEINL